MSEQQQVINQQPHFLYLAYFAPGLVKVGISQEVRGIRRLLEQGARIALKLETFPSAEIARQYEAKIAQLEGIVEHVSSRKKLDLLKDSLNETAAATTLNQLHMSIASQLGISFPQAQIIHTSTYYLDATLNLSAAVIMKDMSHFVGTVKAVIGSFAVLEHAERLLVYNLKSFIGYRATPTEDPIDLELPSEQMTLF